MELPYEKRFHFQDGSAAKSLDELGKKIEGMSYAEFYRHVSGEKNDFANWIRYVLRDAQLADDLQAVTSIVETVEIINDYLRPRGGGLQGRIEREVLHLELPSPLADDAEMVEPPTIEEIALAPPDTTDILETTDREPDDDFLREPTNTGSAIDGNAPAAPAAVAAEQEWHGMHTDVGRMIVKDFILGMLLGILIGFLLGRVFILP